MIILKVKIENLEEKNFHFMDRKGLSKHKIIWDACKNSGLNSINILSFSGNGQPEYFHHGTKTSENVIGKKLTVFAMKTTHRLIFQKPLRHWKINGQRIWTGRKNLNDK